MKIVYFVDGLNRGGVESVVCHLSSSFAKLRNKIYIICLHKDMNDLHLEIPEYISVFYLPFESNRNHHVNYIRYLPNLVDLLKKIKPDIVHAHRCIHHKKNLLPDKYHSHLTKYHFSYFFLSIGILLSRTVPVNIRSIHFSGFFLEKRTIEDKIRFIFDWCACRLLKTIIISVGPTVSRVVKRLYTSNQHLTIVNGIDTKEKFCKRNLTKSCMGISEDKYVAVYVARICEGKNHDTLIKAWEIVTQYHPSALLLFIGDGPLKEQYQSVVHEKSLDDKITFTGSIPNIVEYLSIADVGVFPSESEGLPLVLMEMMAVELPVVASKIPSCCDLIEENVNGILYETYDYKDLANKILSVLCDNELKKKLGEQAKLLVCNHYSIENMINRHNILYQKLLLKQNFTDAYN